MAIIGLDVFKQHFSEHMDKFVLIGGSACCVNLDNQGLPFRATKDLDIVMLINAEHADPKFVEWFWRFIRLGGYQIKQRSSGKPIFYRFEKPDNEVYPVMLELFSRKLGLLELHGNSECIPIPVEDELSSLSAIILSEEYYTLIENNHRVISGIPVVTPECLIMLKVKAFLDLTGRKAAGENIDSNKIKKHKNDVFRIAQLLSEDTECILSAQIKEDLREFIAYIKDEAIDVKKLGIIGMDVGDVLDMMKKVYGV